MQIKTIGYGIAMIVSINKMFSEIKGEKENTHSCTHHDENE